MSNLIGIAPESQHGVVFSRASWGWQPLWTYCDNFHADICDNVDYPFADYGDGLDADDARALALRLVEDLETGVADNYILARDLVVFALPDSPCSDCGSTGVRTDEVGHDMRLMDMELRPDQAMRLGRSHGWCNSCFGEGRLFAWEKAYRLSTGDIREFAAFLHDCGGFNIQWQR